MSGIRPMVGVRMAADQAQVLVDVLDAALFFDAVVDEERLLLEQVVAEFRKTLVAVRKLEQLREPRS